MLDEHIGRRPALERAACLMAHHYRRANALRLFNGGGVIPITQQHAADTLGLSAVHTNKTLKKVGRMTTDALAGVLLRRPGRQRPRRCSRMGQS
ncbi:Transcriptional regulator, Crp/Fnr family [Rhizobium freirei PRF 81]|uniref:Transcriptional regulator, Crp/Fnr family n=1 Tax=Rhizobium freirei PRF 81 TaxID=363754 RepID=N6UX73_9HYPH|nr:Transcriptional regulator, Crp/Fnr family [Rhizobium freirei PRF 81]